MNRITTGGMKEGGMSKTLAILGILTATALGLHYTGLVNFTPALNKAVHYARQAELIEKQARTIIIGLDITAGREKELEKDWRAIDKLVAALGNGDEMSVYLIHSRAESEQETVFFVKMPEHAGPAGQLLTREKKAAQDAWKSCWQGSVLPMVKSDKAQRTDLFGFMRFVASEKARELESGQAVLILFTDGQQVGDGFNMEKKAPAPEDLEGVAGRNFIPELRGACLIFAGVTPTHGIDNAHWRQIQTFWKGYGKKAGASRVSVSSERAIVLDR